MIEHLVGPARCPRAAAKKVALGHVFLFPSYAFLFNVWMGGLEGKGFEGGVRKFMDTWRTVFVAGSVFWPAANMVNFMYCPPKHRVLFLNGGGLFWNAFLSYQNAKSNAKNALCLPLEAIKPRLAGRPPRRLTLAPPPTLRVRLLLPKLPLYLCFVCFSSL